MQPTDSDVLILSAADVYSCFDEDSALDSQREAFRSLGAGTALQPERIVMESVENSSTFCYAARISPDQGSVCKFGSVVPQNASRGMPTVSATIFVLDPETGQLAAIIDGTSVTTVRTAAGSAVAAEHLANPGASVLAVVGAGTQAEAHIRLFRHVMDLTDVRVFSADAAAAEDLALRLTTEGIAPTRAVSSSREALADADVIVTATTSAEPVFGFSQVKAGSTVLSIGSYAADRREVPPELVAAAEQIVVDHAEIALEHAGPIVSAVQSGDILPSYIVSLSDVVTQKQEGRRTSEGIVYYNSVGIGVQDAAAANVILERARAAGLGQRLRF